jgi:hypothetical protein
MNGEKKLVIVAVGLVALCITVLYVFLFIALWDYRQFDRHQEETPLDMNGEPLYWRQEYQANPHRQ